MRRRRYKWMLAVSLIVVPSHAIAEQQQQTGKEREATPLRNEAGWLRDGDYPSEELRNDVEGTVYFTLKVETDGRASSCQVTQSSGSQMLDTTACNLVTLRARFDPAKDRKGRPIVGSYSSRVRWTIPENHTLPAPEPGELVYSWTLTSEGTPSDCVVERMSGRVDASIKGPGPIKCPSHQWTPYLDAKGQPVAKRVRMTSKVEVEDLK